MEQAGEHRIAAGRWAVWRALNDPAVLQHCIDGCRSMEKRSEGEFAAVVKAKVGPLRTTFNAVLRLADLQPPESYSIRIEAKGGPVGFGKGVAHVTLQADDGATVLRYRASVQVAASWRRSAPGCSTAPPARWRRAFLPLFRRKWAHLAARSARRPLGRGPTCASVAALLRPMAAAPRIFGAFSCWTTRQRDYTWCRIGSLGGMVHGR